MTPAPVPRYEGLRCLVLGADGFIGRWVTHALADAGADVHAAVLDPEAASHVWAAHAVAPTPHVADLLPEGSAARLLRQVAPDVVFNLAGYGVRPDESDSDRARRLNAGLVAELCAAVPGAAADTDAPPALVHVGSAAEYGDAGGDLVEDGEACPSSLYGRTKLAGTQALLESAQARGTRAVVARPFTVYGPGEPPHRLLPTLLRASGTGAAVPLGAGRAQRDFTYVEDVAEGLLRLGRASRACGQAVNLCTGTLIAVRDFVGTAAGILGIADDALRFGELGDGRFDMAHDAVSIARLEDLVGWHPRIDVAEGVRRTRDFVRGERRDD